MNKKTISISALLSTIACLASSAQVLAQGSNDFFGSSVPTTNGQLPGAAAAAQQVGNPDGNADNTQDEKRMQKKFRANLQSAQDLIAKGERMIKDGEKRHQDKEVKKGKILKEIGEKRVAELKANTSAADLSK